MKCPKCESENIQSHIIVGDKKARDTKIIFGVLLGFIALFCLINLAGGNTNMLFLAILGTVFAMPICIVLRIVLMFIPARQKTVFVCNNCGAEFAKSAAIKAVQTENNENI